MSVIKQGVVGAIRTQFSGTPTENISVTFLTPVTLPTQNVGAARIVSEHKNLLGNTLVRINYYSEQAAYVGASWVSLQVDATRNYIQATRPVSKGHKVEVQDLVETPAAIYGMNSETALTKGELIGQEAVVPIKKGQFISKKMLQSPFAVRANTEILIELEEDGVLLKFTGTAMQAGQLGDTIQVKGKDYPTLLKGVIVDSKTVKVSN